MIYTTERLENSVLLLRSATAVVLITLGFVTFGVWQSEIARQSAVARAENFGRAIFSNERAESN